MLECLAAVVALHHADHLRSQLSCVLQTSDLCVRMSHRHQCSTLLETYLKTSLQAKRRLCMGIHELLLHKLERCKRTLELVALERICPRTRDAVLKCADGAPGYPVPTPSEAQPQEAGQRTAAYRALLRQEKGAPIPEP